MYIGNNPRNNKYIVPLCGFLLSILSLLAIPQICFSTAFDGNYDSSNHLYTKEAGADGCVHVSYTNGGWQNMNLGVSEYINTNASINMSATNIQFVDPSSCHCDGNDYYNCGQYNGKEIKFGGSTMSGGSVSGAKGQTFTYGNMSVQVDIGSVLGAEPGSTYRRTYYYYSCNGGSGRHTNDRECPTESAKEKQKQAEKPGGGGWYECGLSPHEICYHRDYPNHSYWYAYVTAEVDRNVARPGETVYFTYKVHFLGGTRIGQAGDGGHNFGVAGTESEGTGALTTSDPVTVNLDTDNNGGRTHEVHTITGYPGEVKQFVIPKVIDQNDVGHNVVGTISISPIDWRCTWHGECYSRRASADVTVHYNWDNDLKSEHRVDSHWNQSKPYGTEIVNAYPKDNVYFKHTGNLRYHYIGDALYTKTNSDINYYDHNNLLGSKWVDQWSFGTYPGTSRPVVEGYVNNTHLPLNVTQDNVNTTMCEHITAKPGAFHPYWRHRDQSGYFDPERSSNEVCVHFPYHYTFEKPPYGPAPRTCSWYGNCPGNLLPKDQTESGIKLVVHRESDDRVLLGDPFEFKSNMSFGGGRTKTKPYKFHSYIAVVNGDAVNTNNMEGPLVYPNAQGFNNSAFNCMIGVKNGAHKIAPGNIKKCYELCSGRGDWNGKITCEVDQKDGIAWNDTSGKTIAYDGQFNETLFRQARPKPGDKICYWAAISDWAAIDDISAPSILVSNMVCTDVAKQPQMKIIGGDAIAGKNIVGAVYNKVNPINGNRGSWSQYGLFAHDGISHFGSAGFSNPWYVHHNNSCRLSYANQTGLSSNPCNIDKLGKLGHFGMSSDGVSGYAPKIPDIDESSAKLKPLLGELNLNTIGKGVTVGLVYRGVGDLNIYGDLADKARVVVYVPKGRMDPDNPQVNITGDIKPKSKSFDRLSSIPSLTVIADNDINVNAAVSNMFGNYISRGGRISTCKEAKGTETDDTGYKVKPRVISTKLGVEGSMVCNRKPLKVQGTLISAGDVIFYRTYGSENFDEKTHHDEKVRALASEEVDYTPNTFLLPYYQSYNFEDKTSFIVRTAKNMIPRY